MDLDFTQEQDMLRETVRGLCAQYITPAVVRDTENDPVGYPAQFWKQLAALDLIGLTLPVDFGGSGQSALEAAVMYEEFGAALAPSPHFVSSVMTGGLLTRGGTDAQREAWLPRIASGDTIATVAWLEPGGGFGPEGVQMSARPRDGEFVLDGRKWLVPFASAADVFAVLARSGDGVGVFLVDPSTAGVSMKQQHTIASDAVYEVGFAGVRAERVGTAGWATWEEVMREGAVLLAAQAIGGARRALDITVRYALDREQFDKPLAAFQSISHYLADADTAVEGGRVLVYEAAWASARKRPLDRLAPMAKLFACQTFRDVTAMCQQVWGGMGFTVEADVQLYFRRAKALQLTWWDDRYLEELVATAVLG
jgi:alkylation response protein AidB-like acyl-CoA dehydrogenase